MANVINATSTGNGGLITTGDDSGVLNIQTNETTAMSVDASQSVDFTNNIDAPNTFGFKNRLINGAMNIWQRGTSFTLVAATTTYTADRWYVNTTGGTGAVSQTGSLGAYSLRITGASGISSGFVGQKIESNNIADLAGSTVTYKIRASSSVLTSLTWYARYPTAQDNYASVTLISSNTINITSTPTDYTFQISLPSGAVNGLEVYFSFGSFTSGTLDITNVQLEKGTQATSFDFRSYGTELALCQRYLPAFTRGSSNAYLGTGWIYNSSTAAIYVPFQVAARTTPSGVTTAGSFSIDSTIAAAVSSFSISTAAIYGTTLSVSSGTSMTAGYACGLVMNNAAGQVLFTGCEL